MDTRPLTGRTALSASSLSASSGIRCRKRTTCSRPTANRQDCLLWERRLFFISSGCKLLQGQSWRKAALEDEVAKRDPEEAMCRL
jgi:hypothetical protein